MKIKSEWELLSDISKKIKEKGLPCPNELITGIGDDCAVYKIDDNRYAIITTDISIESTHFIVKFTRPQDIGFKAMMGNFSDIAAMGGTPKLAFISIGIPDYIEQNFILSLYDGMLDAANRSKTVIAGGDTSKANQLIINILIYGETIGRMPVLRKNAKTGDTIYVTGTLGDSIAGLEILTSLKKSNKRDYKSLLDKHQRPSCRLDLVEFIIKEYMPSSMIDISDGLISDLSHICDNSKKGCKLFKEQIPISDTLKKYSQTFNIDPYKLAIDSGEEYELLFTSPRPTDDIKTGKKIKADISPIGEILDNGFYLMSNGKKEEIPVSGYNHFRP